MLHTSLIIRSMSVTVKISGRVKTLSRNKMHSFNKLADCSYSSEMSSVACFQIRASNSSDRISEKNSIKSTHTVQNIALYRLLNLLRLELSKVN